MVALAVVVLANRVREALHQLVDLPFEQLGKAEQERRLDAALREILDHAVDVDRSSRLPRRRHEQMPVLADREVAVAPAVEPVDVDRVVGREPFGERDVHVGLSAPGPPMARGARIIEPAPPLARAAR